MKDAIGTLNVPKNGIRLSNFRNNHSGPGNAGLRGTENQMRSVYATNS